MVCFLFFYYFCKYIIYFFFFLLIWWKRSRRISIHKCYFFSTSIDLFNISYLFSEKFPTYIDYVTQWNKSFQVILISWKYFWTFVWSFLEALCTPSSTLEIIFDNLQPFLFSIKQEYNKVKCWMLIDI